MLNIVLFEPLIPQNTGNIMRTCVGLGIKLHLIKPLGFSFEEKYLKRAALDYFDKVDFIIYENMNDFYQKTCGSTYYYYSRYGLSDYTKANYIVAKNKELYLIFGKETTGIDKEILHNNLNTTYRIPTTSDIRSLNLSNSVAIVAYHAMDKLGFPNLELYEPKKYKGKNFIKNYKGE